MRNRSRPLLAAVVIVLAIAGAWAFNRSAIKASPDPDGYEGPFAFGTTVSEDDVHAYNVRPNILPDGRFLPDGSGTVTAGADLYAQSCARCHGPTGTEGPFNVLVGRGSLTRPQPPEQAETTDIVKTVGNYWPYATSVWAYIHRTMPFDNPGTLSADDTYSIVAWLLNQNEIVPDDFTANQDTLPNVQMPARDIFVSDPRPWPPVQ